MSIKSILESIDSLEMEFILTEPFMSMVKKEAVSKSDIKFFSNKMAKFRKLSVSMVLKYITTFAICKPDLAIDIARRKGVFRYNVWGIKDNKALFLLKKLNDCKMLAFSTETQNYIDSKIKLSWIFDFYKESETKIISFIKEHYKNRYHVVENGILYEEALFKELLAYDDMLFINNQPLNTSDNKDKLHSYSYEEISESISYLIYLCTTNIDFSQTSIPIVIPNFVKSKKLEEIILLGCKVCKIKEWEVFLDFYPYSIKTTDNRIYTISAKDATYDKSMRLGYVNTMLHTQFSMVKNDEMLLEVPALSDLSHIFKSDTINFIEEAGTGYLARYRILIPEFLLKKVFEDRDAFFKEELLEIQRFSNEFNIPGAELLNKKITENCTLKDVILFKRFFAVFNYIAGQQLLAQKNANKIISSLLPAFSKQRLIAMIGKLIGSVQKAEELIKLFMYNNRYKLDLQYTPLLNSFELILMPLFLTVKSNFLRNCIAQSYLVKNQIVNQDDKEYLVLYLKEILESNHPEFKVFTNRIFKYNNQNGEIDALLITDKSLYLFECKSPLEPTSNFELRSTDDHICKAAKQLTLSRKAFADIEFQRRFLKNLGIEYIPRNIYTCIVMGNRIFNGLTVSSHPVRYISELDMIVNNGIIRSNIGDWRCWKKECFTEDDLIKFLSENDALHKANFDAMVEFKQYMHIKGKRIELSSFLFDIYQAILNYDKKFTIINRDNIKYEKIKNNIEKSRRE